MRMTAQIKPHPSNPFGSILPVKIMKLFEFPRPTNGLHNGAPMWLFHFHVNLTTCIVLNARLIADGTGIDYRRSAGGKTRYFTTYHQVASFLRKYSSCAEFLRHYAFCLAIDYDAVPICWRADDRTSPVRRRVWGVFPQHELLWRFECLGPLWYAWVLREPNRCNSACPGILRYVFTSAAGTQFIIQTNKHNCPNHWNRRGKPWSFHISILSAVSCVSTINRSASTRNTSGTPVSIMGHTASRSTPVLSNTSSLLIESLGALSTLYSFA